MLVETAISETGQEMVWVSEAAASYLDRYEYDKLRRESSVDQSPLRRGIQLGGTQVCTSPSPTPPVGLSPCSSVEENLISLPCHIVFAIGILPPVINVVFEGTGDLRGR